jgi:hypothetical protein
MDALEQVSDWDESKADAIDAHVEWLGRQIANKRKQVQILRARIDELGGGYNEHDFYDMFNSESLA